MANKFADITYAEVGKQRTITIDQAGGTNTLTVRVSWDNASRQSDVIAGLVTIEEAFKARLRAENFCAANS